jgi:CrcB protein
MLAVLSNHEGHWMSHLHVQRFFIVGLLGGFTTFSSFSLQTLQLFQQGHA